MEYTTLRTAGAGPVRVSRLGFGCEPLGGCDWGEVDPADIALGITDALEQGWTYFDTAAVYGLGCSEQRLRDTLGARRESVVIATKAGLMWEGGENGSRATIRRDASPAALRASVEASLRRLGLETIPLVFLHYADPLIPVEESVGALEELRRAGKLAALGVSNFGVDLLERATRETVISTVQLECSILNLAGEASPASALEWCRAHNVPVIAYGVLARGLLSGKFGLQRPHFPPTDRRARLAEFQGPQYVEHVTLVSKLTRFARDLKVPMSALAVRWVLDVMGVDIAITGVHHRDHVGENVQAMGWKLPERAVREIKETIDHAYSFSEG